MISRGFRLLFFTILFFLFLFLYKYTNVLSIARSRFRTSEKRAAYSSENSESEPDPHSDVWVMRGSETRLWYNKKTEGKVQFLRARLLLRNKHIVMIGDSLMRYQYLSLIGFLFSSSWDFTSSYPSLENEQDWPSWRDFFFSGMFRFGACYEIVDAFRNERDIKADGKFKENRYYFDPVHNISISFFGFFPGASPLQGIAPPKRSNFSSLCKFSPTAMEKLMEDYENPMYTFRYNSTQMAAFLVDVVKPMRPHFLFFNQYVWADDEFRAKPNLVKFARAAAASVIEKSFWKTTTCQCVDTNHRGEDEDFLRLLKNNGMHIFDAYNMTENVCRADFFGEKVCRDGLHFREFVNRELNKLLLQTIFPLQHLPNYKSM